MNVLLVRPAPASRQFGLVPFFQTEPLGLEYVAASLRRHGHGVTVVDMRFERRRMAGMLRRLAPDLVGISCIHIGDAQATVEVATQVKEADGRIRVVVGGHAASIFPAALEHTSSIDAIVIGEGEHSILELCDALAANRGVESVPGLQVRRGNGQFEPTHGEVPLLSLNDVLPPDRSTVSRYQRRYCCLNYMPVWTMETARGCSYRCRFCSVWEFHRRSVRYHAAGTVQRDFAAAGDNLFIVDDTFWENSSRGEELASALLNSSRRKNWILVQSRADTVAANPGLLRRWRPLARTFDIFFGFEAPTREKLDALNKDVDVTAIREAVAVARSAGFGVTGNFIIDPAYSEEDFAALWEFLGTHQIDRVGFTILTPLPGTRFFDSVRDRIEVFDWNHYDLHHLVSQPELTVERFFELYCETWRRSVLNLAGRKTWRQWLNDVHLAQAPRLVRILRRTQQVMNPRAYLSDTAISTGARTAELPVTAQRTAD